MTPVHMKEQQGLDISVYRKIGIMCMCEGGVCEGNAVGGSKGREERG